MHKRDDPLWEWSVFWQSDQPQSCMPANEPENTDGLAATWQEFFADLPAGARILDLGTGNGSLATRAVAASRSKAKRFSIHGVDLAEIQPARFVASASDILQEITFHARTPMEKLPFADCHFDAVVSQYGLEYSQTDQSLAEAVRVLRPRGWFRFLLHADDGVLKSRCELQRQQADVILGSQLFGRLSDALEKIVAAEQLRTSQSLESAEKSIAGLKGALDHLEQEFADSSDRSMVDNLLAAVRRLPALRKSCSLKTLLAMAEDVRTLLVAQAKRLQAMAHAALDAAAAEELAEKLRSIQATDDVRLERATAGTREVCIGYWLYGNKAADGARNG